MPARPPPQPPPSLPGPTRRLTWPRRNSSSNSGGSAQRSPGQRGGGRASRAAGFMPCAFWNVPGTRESGPGERHSPGSRVAASSRRLRLLLRQPVRLVPAPPAPGFPGDMAAAAATATQRSPARRWRWRWRRGGGVPGRAGASRGGASGAHPQRAAPGCRRPRPARLPLPPRRVMRLGLQGAAASARRPRLPSPSEYSSLPPAPAGQAGGGAGGRAAAHSRGPFASSRRSPRPRRAGRAWRGEGSGDGGGSPWASGGSAPRLGPPTFLGLRTPWARDAAPRLRRHAPAMLAPSLRTSSAEGGLGVTSFFFFLAESSDKATRPGLPADSDVRAMHGWAWDGEVGE